MQVFQEVVNGATASDFHMFIGGRQYSIVGKYVPKYRFTGDWRGAVTATTTPKPLVSFRLKSGYKNRSVKLDGFNVENAGNNRVLAEIRINGTLTGETYGTPGNHTAAETGLESDVAATAITGGVVVYPAQYILPAKDSSVDFGGLDLDLPEASSISLVAYTLTGSADVYSTFQLREEW